MMKKALSTMVVLVLLLATVACNPREDSGGTNTSSANTAGASAGSSTTASSAAGATWGNAPDFSYTTFDGATGKLSDFAGQPVVINFWAVWCPPCKTEMPEFQHVYEAKTGQFVLLALAVDSRNDPAAYFKQQGFTYTGGMGSEAARHYVDNAIPVTVFIDRRGNVAHTQTGSVTQAEFESLLGKIL